jgi:hypothetical protein
MQATFRQREESLNLPQSHNTSPLSNTFRTKVYLYYYHLVYLGLSYPKLTSTSNLDAKTWWQNLPDPSRYPLHFPLF